MSAADERRPLRVLHAFATFTAAGPQLRTLDLIAGLGPALEHEIIACDDDLSARDSAPQDCPFTCLPCPEGTGFLGPVRAWRKLLRQRRPDLLLTYNWGSLDAVLAARSLGLRSHIHHEDGFNADEVGGQLRRRVWTRRLALGRITKLIVPSRLLEEVAQEHWKVPGSRVARVLNGVSTERFHADDQGRAQIRTRLGLAPEDLLLGSVGHLRPVKRYDRLLRSLALLRQQSGNLSIHVCLVGAGPERSGLEQLAGELGLTDCVHWAGHQTDLTPWYSAMDLFTLTSDSEQLPVSLLEAMACGLPVAATDVGDIRATLPEANRKWLVAATDPGSAEQLARVYLDLLGDPSLRRAAGQSNLGRVTQDYSRDQMIGAYRALYLEAMGK